MEVLINLVIIFIVIVTVLKRIQELAKKQGEIKIPPASPPVPFPELFEEPVHPEKLEEEEIKPVSERVSSLEEVFEKIRPEFVEPEISLEPEIPTPAEEPVLAVEQPILYEKAVTRRKVTPGLTLHFSGSELVSGIVMREILGPPVSMQNERWW